MKRTSTILRKAVVLAIVGFSTAATAATQYCTGTISTLWIDNGGNVMVSTSWRNDHLRICNVNDTLGTVTPTTCLGWAALLRAAQQSQRPTIINYSDAPACNTLPTYSNAPIPYYVMLTQ